MRSSAPLAAAHQRSTAMARHFLRQRFLLSSRKPLAGALLGASLAIAGMGIPAPAHAATRVVSNCNDSGAGSLRRAVSDAASGDVIDLTGLTCNRIVFTLGWITVAQDDLRLVGPGRFALTLDGNNTVRIFRHTGSGSLRIERMSLANGRYRGRGGCILSEGNVELIRARVHHCRVDGDVTSGGGIDAFGNVLLSYSSVFANATADRGSGGGISAFRKVTLYRSQVYANTAGPAAGIRAGELEATYSLIHGNQGTSFGGGVFSTGRVVLNKSTVSANRVRPDRFNPRAWGGGLVVGGDSLVIDSTISGNTASTVGGAAFTGATIINSTIAFNLDETANPEDNQCDGALSASPLRLENSIVARNRCGAGPPWDIDFTTITGSNNLIEWSKSNVPADTILYTDPRLAPLAENGGPTRTHMLLADSPAINRGHNDFNRDTDQRGPGFPRVKGAFPDIGAIER
jgi:hypothetical protein